MPKKKTKTRKTTGEPQCPKCHKLLTPGDDCCEHCGLILDWDEDIPSAAACEACGDECQCFDTRDQDGDDITCCRDCAMEIDDEDEALDEEEDDDCFDDDYEDSIDDDDDMADFDADDD